MTGVTDGWLTVGSGVVEVIGSGDNPVVRSEVDKMGRSLSEKIDEGSHDELGGGIGFLRFGQCSMGWSLAHTLHLWKALKDSKLVLSHEQEP